MTTRELRLRKRIDDLIDQRDEAKATIESLNARLRRRFPGFPGHCRWCGGRTRGQSCALHADLERMERELYR